MSDYDAITAHYYAAYRPPLHQQMLAQVLSEKRGRGLDIGCGTGHSTRALAAYCEHVIGVDPSADMLALAGNGAGIRYQKLPGATLPFADRQFDTVTFAGSLYHAKSSKLLDEVLRVGKPGTRIIVYDFDLPLEGCYRILSENPEPLSPVDYDHAVDFSELRTDRMRETHRIRGEESVMMDFRKLAYLLLSDRRILRRLVEKLGTEDLPARVEQLFGEKIGRKFGAISIPAKTYLAAYCIGD